MGWFIKEKKDLQTKNKRTFESAKYEIPCKFA